MNRERHSDTNNSWCVLNRLYDREREKERKKTFLIRKTNQKHIYI